MRTLEVYTTAILDATLAPAAAGAGGSGATAMDRWRRRRTASIAGSCTTTRAFIEYFRAATPERELGLAPIGSRPARRGGDGGVESLRAIPWVFAWTQTRLLLPSWLGTGEALAAAIERGERALIREMARDWPFFSSTLRLIEMALAEAEPAIAAAYDRELVPDELKPLGEDLRAPAGARAPRRARRARRARAARGQSRAAPLDRRPQSLRRSDQPRPDRAARRDCAATDVVSQELWQAFLVTVNGIAAGMRNVG